MLNSGKKIRVLSDRKINILRDRPFKLKGVGGGGGYGYLFRSEKKFWTHKS